MDKSATVQDNKNTRPSLDGKTAIVTGSGRGIGAATSRLLASRGANVIVNYLNNTESAKLSMKSSLIIMKST
jgi:3-oxoacyl-[acyl-carrier protein] reductase